MGKVLDFTRANQCEDFSDIEDAVKRIARSAALEALAIAQARHPKTFVGLSSDDKAIAASELAMSLLEKAVSEVRTGTVRYLVACEVRDAAADSSPSAL